MADMKKHPTVVRYYESSAQSATLDNETLDYEWIREMCLEAGAADQAKRKLSLLMDGNERSKAYSMRSSVLAISLHNTLLGIRVFARTLRSLEILLHNKACKATI